MNEGSAENTLFVLLSGAATAATASFATCQPANYKSQADRQVDMQMRCSEVGLESGDTDGSHRPSRLKASQIWLHKL